MKKIVEIFLFIVVFFIPAFVFAASPLFMFTPLTPTTIQLVYGSATVQYTVQNQSSRTHSIIIKSIPGVTQITSAGNCPSPFTLVGKQSCRLTLQISAKQIASGIHGGPVACQQENGQPNPLLCYQPSLADSLNVTAVSTPVIFSGTQNGNVYYSTNNGSSWTATTTPGTGSAINNIFATNNILYAASADGFIYYSVNSGNSWSHTSSPDGSSVNSIFVLGNILYATTANGFVYYSTDSGNTWISAASTPDGSSVNGIFVSGNTLYVGTDNGNVYYSTNNGATWIPINGQPDGSAVKNIFVNNNTLYVDTANEYVFSSTSLTGGGTWTPIAQTVYSLFVDANNNSLYAGTQSGYVFSVTNGTELGFVTNNPINSVFVLN